MWSSSAILALSLGAIASCVPLQKRWAPKPVCTDIIIPVQATANNTVFPAYPTSTAPGVMYQYLQSFNASALPVATVFGSFNISATYCQPSVNVTGREGTIQFLLHGLSQHKGELPQLLTGYSNRIQRYWTGEDFSSSTFQGEYSWAYHAASQGYASLAIDNLGNGNSSRPDPITVVQPAMQLAVIHTILGNIRAGSVPSVPKYDKIVMASHSYGSVLARLVATVWPTSGADAYILTAAAGNLTGLVGAIRTFAAQSASAVDSRFPSLAPAYMSLSKGGVRDSVYGLDGQFDPNMLAWDEAFPHVFAVGEIAFFKACHTDGFRRTCDGDNWAHRSDCVRQRQHHHSSSRLRHGRWLSS